MARTVLGGGVPCTKKRVQEPRESRQDRFERPSICNRDYLQMIKYQLNVRLTVYQKIVGKKIWLGQKKFELKKKLEKNSRFGPAQRDCLPKKKDRVG